jgi:hypothetical protein
MSKSKAERNKMPSIKVQQKALKKYILETPIEEVFKTSNEEAVEVLRRAGLAKDKPE